jgi:hypothetical protein
MLARCGSRASHEAVDHGREGAVAARNRDRAVEVRVGVEEPLGVHVPGGELAVELGEDRLEPVELLV